MTTILPPPTGLRIVCAFRNENGWEADVPVPVLALAISPDLDVQYVTASGARPLENSLDTLSSREPLRELEWQDALVLATGEVLTAGDMLFVSVDSWIEALRQHPYSNRTAASIAAKTPTAPTTTTTTTTTKRRDEEPVLA